MKKNFLPIIVALINLSSSAQVADTVDPAGSIDRIKIADSITNEGKRIYKSEMASWYGTDVFLEHHKETANIGGYFSYPEDNKVKCVFFSKESKPKVIGTISFDSSYNTKTAVIDLTEREFTATEGDIFSIRKIALAAVNSDSLFKSYKNTRLNLIPLVNGNDRKVYILTGTDQNGVVIFGNDYLLSFDASNNLISKKQLHRNLIVISSDAKEENKQVFGTVHNHAPETGDFITATDICTLMLYERFTNWEQHMVVSGKYLNIWNCKTNQLIVVPTDTMNKINEDQGKKKKKNNE